MLRLSAEQDGREQTGRWGQMAGLRDGDRWRDREMGTDGGTERWGQMAGLRNENERTEENREKQRKTEKNREEREDMGEYRRRYE